jgi:hypothetical protein
MSGPRRFQRYSLRFISNICFVCGWALLVDDGLEITLEQVTPLRTQSWSAEATLVIHADESNKRLTPCQFPASLPSVRQLKQTSRALFRAFVISNLQKTYLTIHSPLHHYKATPEWFDGCAAESISSRPSDSSTITTRKLQID